MRSPPTRPRRQTHQGRLTVVLAVGAAVILVVFWLLPTDRGGLWPAVAAWTTLTMVCGALRHRPAHRETWFLLAAAAPLFLASDASDFSSPRHPGATPHAADWISLLAYPLTAAALLIMVRRRLLRKDLAGLLDALVAVGAVSFVAWVFLIGPFLDPGHSQAGRAIAIMYPVGDLVLLGLFAWLLSSPPARTPSMCLLAAGMVLLTVSDAFQSLWRLGRIDVFASPTATTLLQLGWVLFGVCWGAASQTPSMRDSTRPVPVPTTGVPPARLALLAIAALITPAVVMVQLIRDDDTTGWFGPVLASVVFLLVLARVSLVLTEHRRVLEREKILLAANGLLAAAAGPDEVGAALASAATRLLGTRKAHDVLIAVANPPEVQVTMAGEREEAPSRTDSGVWRLALAELSNRQAAVFGLSANLVHCVDLPTPFAEQLSAFEHALVFPLGVDYRPDDAWSEGALVVAADEEDLVPLTGSLSLLARQSGLTLNRISLSQEIARRDGEAYFRALVQNTSDAIVIVGAEFRVRYASPSAEDLFGQPEPLGRPLAELIGDHNAAEVAGRAAGPAPQPTMRREWDLRTPSGVPREVEATVADLRGEPTVGGFVLSLHDVTTTRGLERTLQRHAYRDPLTGLPNRAAFARGLTDALELASPDTSVSVVLLDLDHFREANDRHGREAGDEVLRSTADLLRERLQPGDVLARTGGDEFAVIQVRPADDPPRLPLGLPGEQRPYAVGPIEVTASGSVATARPGSTWASLIGDAEMTLHAAKAAGPRSWQRYEPELRADLARTAARRTGLDIALAEDAFELYYQPLIRLADGALAGFEALVRWPQPDGTVVGPDEFIPLAEATGQILPLGRWILRTAIAQAAVWNRSCAARGRGPVKVSVNASAHELREPRLADVVADALAESSLDPALLVMEATESSLIHHSGQVRTNLRALTRLGIGVALDDFGTGYSSLSYLKDLPVSALKIDKSFVDGVPEVERQTALVQGIIRIAESLDLTVVAEGIETPEQSAALRAMGVDIGQGYLFGRPMPAAQAAVFVELGRSGGPQGKTASSR